jgi:hypothetical protein
LARTWRDWNRLSDSEKGAAASPLPPEDPTTEGFVVVVTSSLPVPSCASVELLPSPALRLRRRTAGGPWPPSRQLQGSV